MNNKECRKIHLLRKQEEMVSEGKLLVLCDKLSCVNIFSMCVACLEAGGCWIVDTIL
jgi:hypothetical protein